MAFALVLLVSAMAIGLGSAVDCPQCNREAVKSALYTTHLTDQEMAQLFQAIPTCFQQCVQQNDPARARAAAVRTPPTTTTTTTTTPKPTPATRASFLSNLGFGNWGRFAGRGRGKREVIDQQQQQCIASKLGEPAEDRLLRCMNGEPQVVQPAAGTAKPQPIQPTNTATGISANPLFGAGDIFGFLNPAGGGAAAPQAGGMDFFSSFLGGGSNPLAGLFGAGNNPTDFISSFLGGGIPGMNSGNPVSAISGLLAPPPGTVGATNAGSGGAGGLFSSFLGGGGGGGGSGLGGLESFLGRRRRRRDTNQQTHEQQAVFHQMMLLTYSEQFVDRLCPEMKPQISECIRTVSGGTIMMEFMDPTSSRNRYCDYRWDNQCTHCLHKRNTGELDEAQQLFCGCYDNMVSTVGGRCGQISQLPECSADGGASTAQSGGGDTDEHDVCSADYKIKTVDEILG